MAGRYGDVAARVAGRHGCALLDVHQLMLREADWPRYVGAGTEDGDGLHLSGSGQRFVAEKLLALLPTLGLDRDALAYDAPWGFEVDANEPAASLRARFARHRPGALQANSGVPGLDREESRPLPGAGEPRSYGGVPAGAFLLGARAAWFSSRADAAAAARAVPELSITCMCCTEATAYEGQASRGSQAA